MAAPPYPAYGSGMRKPRGGYARIAGWRLRLIWPTGRGCGNRVVGYARIAGWRLRLIRPTGQGCGNVYGAAETA
jgi:hypothetical protein